MNASRHRHINTADLDATLPASYAHKDVVDSCPFRLAFTAPRKDKRMKKGDMPDGNHSLEPKSFEPKWLQISGNKKIIMT